MSDIQMCVTGCSKRLLCERWTAPYHSHRQAVFPYQPDVETGVCEGYKPNAVAQADTDDTHLKNHNED